MARPVLPEHLPTAVGKRVASVRRERRWTQEQLGERLKIATKNVQRLERGQNLTLRTLESVARVLGVEPRDLLAPGAEPAGPSWEDELCALGFAPNRRGQEGVPVYGKLPAPSDLPIGWVRRPTDVARRPGLRLVKLEGEAGWVLLARAEGPVQGKQLLLGQPFGPGLLCDADGLELDAEQRPVLIARIRRPGRTPQPRSFRLGDEFRVLAELVRAWSALPRDEHGA